MPLYKNESKRSLDTIDIHRLLSSKVQCLDQPSSLKPLSECFPTSNNNNNNNNTILLFVRNGAWIACEVQLAAYHKVRSILKKHKIKLVVVFTSSADFYKNHFAPSLGFDIHSEETKEDENDENENETAAAATAAAATTTNSDAVVSIVIDETKLTHKAVGLKSSVWASLVLPFRYHLKTFGMKALWEALRVSLQNAKHKGAGSSWKQVGTFCFQNNNNTTSAVENTSTTTTVVKPEPTLAWREDYPGDWMPIRDILEQGFGIHFDDDEDIQVLDGVRWPEVLEFVIQCRKENNDNNKNPKATKEAPPTNSVVCGESTCDLKEIRKGLEGSTPKQQ